MRYAAAGGLGAAAAASLVAIVVVFGGVTFTPCPPGHAEGAACAASLVEASLAQAMETAARAPQTIAENVARAASLVPTAAEASSGGGPPAWPAGGSSAVNALSTAAAPAAAPAPTAKAVTATAAQGPLPTPESLMSGLRPTAAAPAIDDGAASDTAVQESDEIAADPRLPETSGLADAGSPAPATSSQPEPPAVRVAGTSVNLRAAPSAASARVARLSADDALTASARSDGWIKVTDADGQSGWVDARYLTGVDFNVLPEEAASTLDTAALEPAGPKAEPASGDTRIVGGKGANVRSGPGMKNGTVFALRGGAEVTVVDEQRGWLQVTDEQGRKGWIYGDFVHS
jgi:uncharacterized protein YgiM (DUF1202 family)